MKKQVEKLKTKNHINPSKTTGLAYLKIQEKTLGKTTKSEKCERLANFMIAK